MLILELVNKSQNISRSSRLDPILKKVLKTAHECQKRKKIFSIGTILFSLSNLVIIIYKMSITDEERPELGYCSMFACSQGVENNLNSIQFNLSLSRNDIQFRSMRDI